jgi:peptide/nickel transport system permease protein
MNRGAAPGGRLATDQPASGLGIRGGTGLAIVTLIAVVAILAPWLAPFDPNLPDFDAVLAPPGPAHLLGTDQIGRDVLSRVLSAARLSLFVGSVSVGVSLLAGATIGLIAGYLGGWLDVGLMLVTDVILAFPAVLLALALAAALGPGLFSVTFAIAMANLPVFARLARAQTRVVREHGYVEARRALGFGRLAIVLGTILPNILPPLITQASLSFAMSILIESYLSFLGVGLQPPNPTWGQMLHDATGFLDQAPWLAWFPGCAITLLALGFNFLGDAMGERLDPRGTAMDPGAGRI